MDSQVAAKAGIGDLLVLEYSYGQLDSISSVTAILQNCHGCPGGVINSGKMEVLILFAMIACTCMDENSCDITPVAGFVVEVHCSTVMLHM